MSASLNQLLQQSRELARLMATAGYLQQVELVWQRCVPPALQQAARTAYVADGVLVVVVANSAVHAKLRNMTMGLVEKLGQNGLHITSIQVRTQPDAFAFTKVKKEKTFKISEFGLDCLSGSLATIKDEGLQDAIKNLLKHQGRTVG
jgi:hypothetical protein